VARPSGVRHASPPVPVAVSFGEGRRPEQATQVRVGGVERSTRGAARPTGPAGAATGDIDSATPAAGLEPATAAKPELPRLDAEPGSVADTDPVAFDGPLALLLALIEARQLDVLTVPLGGLAGAYLEALGGLEGERLPYLSAFVSVAAQLILIKSRALLPRQQTEPPVALADDGPDPETELRRRLIVYRAYRDAGQWLRERALAFGPLLRREPSVALAAGLAGARPPAEPPLDPGLLEAALRGAAHLTPPAPPPPEVVRRTITLAERAEAIREAIRRAPVVVLQDLLDDTADRVLAAVTFLAMLELVKRREIAVDQARPWGPIHCRAIGADGAGVPLGLIDESLEDFA
jgi:segregation and condensation protein A